MRKYESKKVDDHGSIDWSESENHTWHTLHDRQVEIIKNRACNEFIEGIDLLKMSLDRVPQLHELTETLQVLTGWSVTAVPAMIKPITFFELLANKKFPAATFIRRPEELDYLQEMKRFTQ